MITTVANVMTSSPHSISYDQTLSVAHRMMRAHQIRHLPVLHGGRIVGLLSDRDLHLVETLRDVDPEEVTVDEAMSPDPYTVDPETPLADVVAAMAASHYGSAVVATGGRVVGIFTTVDALKKLGELLDNAQPRRSNR